MSDYSITTTQRAYLDSLVCQRISDDENNKALIAKFENNVNSNLPRALKNGWNEDKKDKLAYYIVKEPGENGEPLLFFSLRCGEIVVPFNQEKLRTVLENSEALLDAAYGIDAPEWAMEIVEKLKVNGEVPQKDLLAFYLRHRRNVAKWNSYTNELRLEGDNIIRTKQSLAGVELVHFCKHAQADERWKAQGMNAQRIGKAMFWQFVAPIIRQLRDLVGCEYIYLFAADSSKQGRLINLYKDLGFEFQKDLYVCKPAYDFECYFMCQKVTSLRNRQLDFYRNYNKPKESKKV